MEYIKQLKPVFKSDNYTDFRDLMNKSADRFADNDAFIIKHRKSRKEFTYEKITFDLFRQQVNQFGTGLMKAGCQGKKIAIIGKNRYEWLVSYFAVLGGLGICVPLDKGLPYEELESSLARSGSEVLIFDRDHSEHVERLKAAGTTEVSLFISMDELEDHETVRDYIAKGSLAMEEGFDDYLRLPVRNDSVDLLLFTSGTTSMAKAVMLTQKNVMADLEAILQVLEVHPDDVSMAFLPYHHTFGAIGQFVMIASGAMTAYCDGLKYLQNNLVEYKVSVFFCVPLLIESIYKKIMATVKKEGKEKTVAFGMKLTSLLLKLGIDIRRKVFKEVLDKLGGNIRLVVSGASAIDPVALEGFKAFGITALQGYGMTESSPVICVENRFEQKTGSIGRPLPGVDVLIDQPDDDGVGELIARGPNVMQGYYENEEETAKVLVDGWLHTGDLAYTDKDGYVFICGRKKNVIVLKNGKNVYPEELEVLINNLPYVEECMVFGQPRFHDGDERDLAVCAKIVYKKEYMRDHHDTEDPEEIEAVIRGDIDRINETLPTYKQMLRIITTDQQMTKTTTGKVKRFEETKNI